MSVLALGVNQVPDDRFSTLWLLADWQFFVYVGKLKAWLCLSRQRTIWRTLEFQVSTQPDAMSGPATVGGVPIDDAPAMVHTT
jgi:hypothetical protein